MRPTALLALAPLLSGCVLPATADSPRPVTPAVSFPPEPEIALDHESLGVDHVLPGAWMEHDGTSHLWIVAFGEALDGPTAMHLVADRSGTWVADGSAVAVEDALGLNEIGPIPSSVLVEADGSWTMYGGGRLPGDRPVIWRATAAGPEGPWHIDPEPILEPTAEGWDSAIVDHPSVIITEDGYLMTYGGASRGAPNRNRVGVARSDDGVRWERVPATLPGADDDVALGPSGCQIEARTMFEPELTVGEAGYRLHFGAILADEEDVMVIGQAESRDGITWTCTVDGPLVEPDDVVAGASFHSYLVQRGDADRILVEVLGTEPSAHSDLWLVVP
jgi:hypothetical protein